MLLQGKYYYKSDISAGLIWFISLLGRMIPHYEEDRNITGTHFCSNASDTLSYTSCFCDCGVAENSGLSPSNISGLLPLSTLQKIPVFTCHSFKYE